MPAVSLWVHKALDVFDYQQLRATLKLCSSMLKHHAGRKRREQRTVAAEKYFSTVQMKLLALPNQIKCHFWHAIRILHLRDILYLVVTQKI